MYYRNSHSADQGGLGDNELWECFLSGDQQALGNLFLRYYARLFRYGTKLIRDEDLVRDSIQELFLKLWSNRATIDEARCIEFYLLYSLRRIIFDQKKRIKAIRGRDERYMNLMPQSLRSAEDKIIKEENEAERYQKFQLALRELSGRQKEVMYLRLQHGLTNSEIADMLNLSKQRVKNCIYEATFQLKSVVYQDSSDKHTA